MLLYCPLLNFTLFTLLSIPKSNLAPPRPGACVLVSLTHLSHLLRLFALRSSFCPALSSLLACLLALVWTPWFPKTCAEQALLSTSACSADALLSPESPSRSPGCGGSGLGWPPCATEWGSRQVDRDLCCYSNIKRSVCTRIWLLCDVI